MSECLTSTTTTIHIQQGHTSCVQIERERAREREIIKKKAMAEILELQEEAIIHPTAAAGSRARKHGGDTGTAAPAAPGSHGHGDVPRKEYPKGVVLGKDGKP